MNNHISSITRRNMLLGSLGLAGAWALPSFATSVATIKGVINTSEKFPAISPYIFGGFIEHIGNLINHSLWSEVLDDRKFYYGVQEVAEPFPTDRRAAGCSPTRGGARPRAAASHSPQRSAAVSGSPHFLMRRTQ